MPKLFKRKSQLIRVVELEDVVIRKGTEQLIFIVLSRNSIIDH